MRLLRTSIALLLVTAAVAPASAGSLDRLLPEDTVLYFGVGDISAIEAKVKTTAMYAFYKEKEVQDFLALPRKAWADAMAKAKAESGTSPDEVLSALRGEMAFAVTGLRKIGDDRRLLGLVALFNVGENEGKVRELIARLEENEEAMSEVRRVVTDARGAKIVSYLDKDEEDGLHHIEKDLYIGSPSYFLQDGLLAVSTDVEALKDVLARRDSTETPSLASGAQYRGVREQTGARADVVLYLNALPIWDVVREMSKDEPMVARVMDALGIFSLRGFGYGAEITRDAVVGRLFLDAPGEKRGLMRLFAGKNSALVPPRFVPPTAGSVMTVAIDFADLWAEVRRAVGKINAAWLTQMDAGLDSVKEQMGVDIAADVIGSLGKEVTVYQLFRPKDATADTMEALIPNVVAAIAVDDADTLNGALGTLLEGVPFLPFAEEEYLGVKMRVMRQGPVSPAFATVAGHLVVAMHAEDLQAVIRSTGKDVKGLVDTDDFARAMSRLPAERMAVSYSHPKLTYELIRDILPNIPGPVSAGMAEWIDLSLLPSWETFDKYFDVSGGVTISNDRGVLSVGRFELKPPK